eukprot:8312754-Pyramimonas_sp.AAC.2
MLIVVRHGGGHRLDLDGVEKRLVGELAGEDGAAQKGGGGACGKFGHSREHRCAEAVQSGSQAARQSSSQAVRQSVSQSVSPSVRQSGSSQSAAVREYHVYSPLIGINPLKPANYYEVVFFSRRLLRVLRSVAAQKEARPR